MGGVKLVGQFDKRHQNEYFLMQIAWNFGGSFSG